MRPGQTWPSLRADSSVGRAPHSHCGGRGFESHSVHHFQPKIENHMAHGLNSWTRLARISLGMDAIVTEGLIGFEQAMGSHAGSDLPGCVADRRNQARRCASWIREAKSSSSTLEEFREQMGSPIPPISAVLSCNDPKA